MVIMIFKNEKKAKVYEIRSTMNQGCYKENELLRIVKTDQIDSCVNGSMYKVKAIEKMGL